MYRTGFNYAKADVMLVESRPQVQQQDEPDLFGTGDETAGVASAEPSWLMNAVDTLNRRFGRGSVTVAHAVPVSRQSDNAQNPMLK